MKIIITGHNGFVGSKLYDRLKTNHEVIGLDIKNGNNLLDCTLDYEVNLVIHLAASCNIGLCKKDPGTTWNNNVEASRRLFSSIDTRYIIFSSSSAAEPWLNIYGSTKFIMEQIAPKNSLILRPSNIWHESPRNDMFLSLLKNKTLPFVTDCKRDFIHVDDICNLIERCVDMDITGTYDVGTGISHKVADLAKLVGLTDLPKIDKRPWERLDNQASTKLQEEIGWIPQHNVINFVDNLPKI